MATDGGRKIGRGAAQHFRQIESTRNGNIAAHAAARAMHPQRGASRHDMTLASFDSGAVDITARRRAAEGDGRGVIEMQADGGQGNLKSSHIGRVANAPIGQRQRNGIGRSRARQGDMPLSCHRLSLHTGLQSAVQDMQLPAHAFSSSNRARPMASKRIGVPAASRLAGSRRGSKSWSGVRPISGQPPGPSNG